MRASPEDWLRAGLVLLREAGPQAITIDALCRALQRTKGSFYHHFADIDAYQGRLLEHWESVSTTFPIDAARDATDARERRRRLYDAVGRLELRMDTAMRAWALHDQRARVAQDRVDARRLAYLADLWKEEGVAPARARSLARVEYAAFLGSIQLGDASTEPGRREARAFARQVLAMLQRELVADEPAAPKVRAKRG